MTTLIPKFDQGGTGAVNRPINEKLSETVSVLDFGADPTGVADSTSAIRATIAYANAQRKFGNSGVYGAGNFYVGTGPTVFFPSGVYKVTDYLTPDTNEEVNYLNFKGEGSIIVASAGVTVFGGVSYMTSFSGLTFRDGACAISIKTNNSDAVTISVNECVFHEQTHSMIRTDATSQSTLLSVTQCTFIQTIVTNAYIWKFLSSDEIYISDSWVYTQATNQAAIYNAAGFLNLTNILLVPSSPTALTGRWIDNYANIYATNCRFGGEYGGCPIIYNYTDLNAPVIAAQQGAQVIIENSNISCGYPAGFGSDPRADAAVMVTKSGLPSTFRVVGCYGKYAAPFIYDGMTTGTLVAYITAYRASATPLSTLSVEITNNNCIGYSLTGDTPSTTALLAYTTLDNPTQIVGLVKKVAQLQVLGQTATASGYTAALGAGGTEDIVTTPNSSFYLVSAAGDTNSTQYASAICYTNASGSVNVTSLVASGISITSSGANKITVTNSATAQQIKWAVLQTQHL